MAYIWQDYNSSNRFTVSFENLSPYMEIWDMSNPDNIAVNPFYRISEVIFPCSDSDSIKNLADKYQTSANYKDIVNLVIHEIAQTDRLKGMDLIFFLSEVERSYILEGYYGDECCKMFNSIAENKRKVILRYLAKYDILYQRENMLDSVLNSLFDTVKMYYEQSTETVLVYISEEESSENKTLFSLVTYLFKDLNVKTEVTWKKHFGIIGNDCTMLQDSIQII